MDYFGMQLRNFRIENGLSQKKLGEILGMSRHTISDLELGKRLPSPEELESISMTLGFDSSDIPETTTVTLRPIESDGRTKFVFTKHYDDQKELEEDQTIFMLSSDLLEQMGMDITDAIRLFLIQVIRQEKLPLDIQL